VKQIELLTSRHRPKTPHLEYLKLVGALNVINRCKLNKGSKYRF
jgi:hypothetical protein